MPAGVDLDWAHFAGGMTGIVIWACVAYLTVGLPFNARIGRDHTEKGK